MSNKPVSFEGTITPNDGSIKRGFMCRQKLVYFTNDSPTYDVLVNINGTIGESGTFTVKAGESINDVPMESTYVCIQSINGNAAVRMLGA